jgi:hypothetical protein
MRASFGYSLRFRAKCLGHDLVKKRVHVHRRGTFRYRLAAWFTQEQRWVVVSRCKGIGLPDRFAALMTVVSVCTNLGLPSTKQGVRQANTRTAGSAYMASGQTCFMTWLLAHNMVCDGAVHETCCKPLRLCRFRRVLFGILRQFVNAVALTSTHHHSHRTNSLTNAHRYIYLIVYTCCIHYSINTLSPCFMVLTTYR